MYFTTYSIDSGMEDPFDFHTVPSEMIFEKKKLSDSANNKINLQHQCDPSTNPISNSPPFLSMEDKLFDNAIQSIGYHTLKNAKKWLTADEIASLSINPRFGTSYHVNSILNFCLKPLLEKHLIVGKLINRTNHFKIATAPLAGSGINTKDAIKHRKTNTCDIRLVWQYIEVHPDLTKEEIEDAMRHQYEITSITVSRALSWLMSYSNTVFIHACHDADGKKYRNDPQIPPAVIP